MGASPGKILRLVLRQGVRLVLIGLVLGMLGASLLGRALSSQLYGVTPVDTGTFAVMSLVLGATALAACVVPALRAVRVDPLRALRAD